MKAAFIIYQYNISFINLLNYFVQYQYDALKGVDAMVLMTEWKHFRQPDFNAMTELMKSKVIFDGRNQYDPTMMTEKGYTYFGIGRTNQ